MLVNALPHEQPVSFPTARFKLPLRVSITLSQTEESQRVRFSFTARSSQAVGFKPGIVLWVHECNCCFKGCPVSLVWEGRERGEEKCNGGMRFSWVG